MTTEYSFVEVLMVAYQPGDVEYSSAMDGGHDSLELFDVDWDVATEPIAEVIQAKKENEQVAESAKAKAKESGNKFVSYPFKELGIEPDLRVVEPLTGFSFRCFGNSFSSEYSGGVDYELRTTDSEYVFGRFLDELKAIGNKLLHDAKEQGFDVKLYNWRKEHKAEIVRFVTLWTYATWHDSYYGEFNSKWDLVGVVKPGIQSEVKTLDANVWRDVTG